MLQSVLGETQKEPFKRSYFNGRLLKVFTKNLGMKQNNCA